MNQETINFIFTVYALSVIFILIIWIAYYKDYTKKIEDLKEEIRHTNNNLSELIHEHRLLKFKYENQPKFNTGDYINEYYIISLDVRFYDNKYGYIYYVINTKKDMFYMCESSLINEKKLEEAQARHKKTSKQKK